MNKRTLTVGFAIVFATVAAVCIGTSYLVSKNEPLQFYQMSNDEAFVVQGENLWHVTLKDGHDYQMEPVKFSRDRLSQIQLLSQKIAKSDEVVETKGQPKESKKKHIPDASARFRYCLSS